MTSQSEFYALIDKYQAGDCTEEEKRLIENWYNQKAINNEPVEFIQTFWQDKQAGLQQILDTDLKPTERKVINWPVRIISIAASITIIAGIGTILLLKSPKPAIYANDIAPGSDKAILTLANGKTINLSDAKSGALLSQAGLEIIKDKDGSLTYKVTGSKESISEYNTITTPNGGEYKVVLSDGTRVWLNAASSLTYMTALNQEGAARKVMMIGEAYFEVAKDKNRPFIVTTNQQEIQVLGTHFNVTAYKNEFFNKTTLLEGSVRITPRLATTAPKQNLIDNGVTLIPNQQAVLTSGKLIVSSANTEEALAWKNGYFRFNDEPLESIMAKLERWYDIEVVFEDDIKNTGFTGTITRNKNISKVLSMLEKTKGVHFKIEGRKVTVIE